MDPKPGQPKINKIELLSKDYYICPLDACREKLATRNSLDSLLSGLRQHNKKKHNRPKLCQDNCSFFVRIGNMEKPISKETLDKWYSEKKPELIRFLKDEFYHSLVASLMSRPQKAELSIVRVFDTPARKRIYRRAVNPRILFDSVDEQPDEVSPCKLLEKDEESDDEERLDRKAETSVTELLDNGHERRTRRTKSPETMSKEVTKAAPNNIESINEEANLTEEQSTTEASTTERQKTETMCKGMSTVLTMQNGPDEMEMMEEIEKEKAVGKHGTPQPQQRQLDKESRMSRLSVLSTSSSYQESLNSGMKYMSLDQHLLDENTMQFDLGKTQFSESRATTAMTIHNEDPSMLPFYLKDGTFETEPSHMDQVLHVVGQKETKTWDSLTKAAFDDATKIGEGSYGEVFLTKWEGKPVAIKVVPFEADKYNRLYTEEYHSGQMQTADQILPELIVMKELNQLKNVDSDSSTPNFIELIAAEIVTGNYPESLLKAWDSYKKESDNTRPDVYSSKNQNFAVLVSANGGVAMEDFVLEKEKEIFSILIQLALSILAAELLMEFEHRDLHIGNLLIDRNGADKLDYKVNGHKIPLEVHGVKVNIIDFTLSRISKEGTTVYLDLEQDPAIFEGERYPQFDVYREMRKSNRGDWKVFNPKSNLMWIEYIGNRLLEPKICPKGLLTKKRKKELRQLFSRLGSFNTVQESLIDTEFYNRFYEELSKLPRVPRNRRKDVTSLKDPSQGSIARQSWSGRKKEVKSFIFLHVTTPEESPSLQRRDSVRFSMPSVEPESTVAGRVEE